MTDNSVEPENGNSTLTACFGTVMESTHSPVRRGESRDDEDSSCHFIYVA